MFEIGLTPCQRERDFFVKREDLACFTVEAEPSGAKVRQYAAMISAAPADAVLAVGCSAASCMQIYVAAMAAEYQRPAYIAVPKRRQRHACTQWCADKGANIIECVPGYPSVYRSRIKQRLRELGLTAVHWNPTAAALDTAAQVSNLPAATKRVVVPNGSGLTAAGIIGGLSVFKRQEIEVHIVSTHDTVGTVKQVLATVRKVFGDDCADGARVTWRGQCMPYQKPLFGKLQDGTLLDPFYAAKAVQFCQADDVLWITGRRPLASYEPEPPLGKALKALLRE